MRVIRTRNSKENLCDNCSKYCEFPTCMSDDVEFGDGIGSDNIVACSECTIRHETISESIYVGEISKVNNATVKQSLAGGR